MRIFKRKKDKSKEKFAPLNPQDQPLEPIKPVDNIDGTIGINNEPMPDLAYLDGDFELPFEDVDQEEFDDVFENDIVDEDSDDYTG